MKIIFLFKPVKLIWQYYFNYVCISIYAVKKSLNLGSAFTCYCLVFHSHFLHVPPPPKKTTHTHTHTHTNTHKTSCVIHVLCKMYILWSFLNKFLLQKFHIICCIYHIMFKTLFQTRHSVCVSFTFESKLDWTLI